MSRCVGYILCILLLAGCATTGQWKGKAETEFLKKSSAVLGFMSSYASVENDFEHGRIMKARSRVLAMEKSHQDYAKAHKLLREKIEPARRRLFVYYLRKAKRAEEKKLWSEAMSAYKQAKDITIKPEIMENKRLKMEYNLRQLRLNVLLRLRRIEDYTLLANPNIYGPPQGASPEDKVFYRKQKQYEDELDGRAARAYREAKYYFRKKMPEIAYVDIESYLRLQPDSDRGKKLLKEIRDAMPRQLTIPPVDGTGTIAPVRQVEKEAAGKKKAVKKVVAKKKPVKRVIIPGVVSAEQIQRIMQRGALHKAKKYALAYRREGGEGAAKLLAKIQMKIEVRASDHFAKGAAAFRQEHLDLAIQHWGKAVALMPEEAEYVEALRRAYQLKERLILLRQASDKEPAAIKE
jgi:tetratricopeptide (TPR) repeat protein